MSAKENPGGAQNAAATLGEERPLRDWLSEPKEEGKARAMWIWLVVQCPLLASSRSSSRKPCGWGAARSRRVSKETQGITGQRNRDAEKPQTQQSTSQELRRVVFGAGAGAVPLFVQE